MAPEGDSTRGPGGLSGRHLLGALPAATAVLLGSIYGLGAMLNTTQLIGAHVPVRDALPLIPLQDHLTEGLADVFTSYFLGITVLSYFVVGLVLYGQARDLRERRRSIDVKLDHARDLAESLSDGLETSEDSDAELAGFKVRGEALKRPDVTPEEVEEGLAALNNDVTKYVRVARQRREATVDELQKREATVRALTSAVEDEIAGLGGTSPWMDRIEARRETIYWGFAFVFLAGAVVSPPILAVGLVVTTGLILGGGRVGLRLGTPPWLVAMFAAALIPQAVNEYTHPSPLPVAEIVTGQGTITGGLITSANGRYVITRRPRTYEAISANRVRSAKVRAAHRPRQKLVLEEATGLRL